MNKISFSFLFHLSVYTQVKNKEKNSYFYQKFYLHIFELINNNKKLKVTGVIGFNLLKKRHGKCLYIFILLELNRQNFQLLKIQQYFKKVRTILRIKDLNLLAYNKE